MAARQKLRRKEAERIAEAYKDSGSSPGLTGFAARRFLVDLHGLQIMSPTFSVAFAYPPPSVTYGMPLGQSGD